MNITLAKETKENGTAEVDASTPEEPGWKAVLAILLAHKHSNQPTEMDPMVRCHVCSAVVCGMSAEAGPGVSTCLLSALQGQLRSILTSGAKPRVVPCFSSA